MRTLKEVLQVLHGQPDDLLCNTFRVPTRLRAPDHGEAAPLTGVPQDILVLGAGVEKAAVWAGAPHAWSSGVPCPSTCGTPKLHRWYIPTVRPSCTLVDEFPKFQTFCTFAEFAAFLQVSPGRSSYALGWLK